MDQLEERVGPEGRKLIWRGQSAPARMRAFDGRSSYEEATV
jgi:hypothetical protein